MSDHRRLGARVGNSRPGHRCWHEGAGIVRCAQTGRAVPASARRADRRAAGSVRARGDVKQAGSVGIRIGSGVVARARRTSQRVDPGDDRRRDARAAVDDPAARAEGLVDGYTGARVGLASKAEQPEPESDQAVSLQPREFEAGSRDVPPTAVTYRDVAGYCAPVPSSPALTVMATPGWLKAESSMIWPEYSPPPQLLETNFAPSATASFSAA